MKKLLKLPLRIAALPLIAILLVFQLISSIIVTGHDDWQQIMRDKRRKTLAVCPACHGLIHSS